MANICEKPFRDINSKDSFFDSLRDDYQGFDEWFNKKALQDENAYVLYEQGQLVCFLYLKEEKPIDNTNILPPLDTTLSWVKVGTLKVNPHRTKLGERLIKRMFDVAISKGIFNLYVTAFPKQEALLRLLKKYGFIEQGKKGDELVLVKNIATSQSQMKQDICCDFPSINTKGVKKYVLAIWPEFHTPMFSDSKLHTEDFNILHDKSESNSIHKVYIAGMPRIEELKRGDLLFIRRTRDKRAPSANYSSVITSLCVVEEYKHIDHFDEKGFIEYCKPHNVFTEEQLQDFYRRKSYPHIIKMTYNISFKKRVVLNTLRQILGREPSYWGFFDIYDDEFKKVLKAGEVDESIIID